MSTSRGGDCRRRPQKHQNRTAFKNDLHDTSKKTKIINGLEVSGVCKRCKEIIQWKIKYKKYKSLSAPSKCVGCNEKAVKYAYHILCGKCATSKKVCAKCGKDVDEELSMAETNGSTAGNDIQSMLKDLPERKRRTILRYINKNGGDGNIESAELKSYIEDVLEKVEDMKLGDEFDFSDEDCSEVE